MGAIDEYIRTHRGGFTREAITAELEKSRHARADIDAALIGGGICLGTVAILISAAYGT